MDPSGSMSKGTSKGPSMDPSGTPHDEGAGDETDSPKLATERPASVASPEACEQAISALLAHVKTLARIVLISVMFVIYYAFLGRQMFGGAFSACVDEQFHAVRNITDEATCLTHGHTWTTQTHNFDNIFQALRSLFVVFSKNEWDIIIPAAGENIQVDRGMYLACPSAALSLPKIVRRVQKTSQRRLGKAKRNKSALYRSIETV